MKEKFVNSFYNKYHFDGDELKCFNSEQVLNFFKMLVDEIVQKLKPRSVLVVGCACDFFVEFLKDKEVLAFGFDVSTNGVEQVSKVSEFCHVGSILKGLPEHFPKKFDLVFCYDVLNSFFVQNIKILIDKLSVLADDIFVGFRKCEKEGFKVLERVNFSSLVGFFAQNGFLKSKNMFFENEFYEISFFSKQVQISDAVQAYECKLADLCSRISELQQINLKLERKVLSYSRNFVNLKLIGQRYVELKHDYSNALIELNVLRSSYERYMAVIESSFWKLTKPMRKSLDFLKINVIGFFKSVVMAISGRSCKKNLAQNKSRKFLNVYSAYFIKTRTTEKILQQQRLVKFKRNFVVSVVVPIYNSSAEFLQQLIDSMRGQTYKFWQLCLADGSDAFHFKERALCEQCARQDKRIKYFKLEKNLGIAQNTNEALKMATGDYIALLDHDDLLSYDALFECMKAVENQGADFVYTDEMTFENDVENVQFIHFKPDFSPDTLRSNNYICHLSLFSKELFKQVGGFSSDYDGSQDYDIILRLTEKAKKIVHVPKILYYWRVHSMSVSQDLINKPYCLDSAKKALAAHLNRLGLKGEVFDSRYPSTYRIEYDLQKKPNVSIIILNCDEAVWLKICVDSILAASTYVNYEILIIENGSCRQTKDFYKVLKNDSNKVRVVAFDGEEFNYSLLVNFGVSHATGEYVVLLHNDVKILTKDWLEQLLMLAQRSEVGAVGAKLLYDDETVQGGGYFLSKQNIAMSAFRLLLRNDGGYVCRACLVQNLSAVSSACLMVSRKVWDDVGGFDEKLAVNFCDVDFCLRLRNKGYLNVFNANVELQHNETSNRKRGQGCSGIEDMINFENERAYMKSKWSDVLEEGDSYYNLNLDDNVCDFSVKKI